MTMDLLELEEHGDDGAVAVAAVGDAQSPLEADANFLVNDARDTEQDEVLASSDDAAFQPLPLRASKRRKIGKVLQLVLLRKYVACAKALNRPPDRPTTEHLLAEGYDEFYFHGGNLNEPRLGYSAFLKLIRNRRCELLRKSHGRQRDKASSTRSPQRRKKSKELDEIHALVDELERVRQGNVGSSFDNMEISETASTAEDTAAETAAETTRPCVSRATPSGIPPPESGVDATTSTFVDGEEHVLVSKRKLELIMRFTQETLQSQKKLLVQVGALERQLLELQSHHHPLGH